MILNSYTCQKGTGDLFSVNIFDIHMLKDMAMTIGQKKLKLGISSCLLGKKVRYDGEHKLDEWIKNTLGQIATFTAACPEYECGMSIPRPPMHLEGTQDNPKLVQTLSKLDLTKQMNNWIKLQIKKLKSQDLDGYIFKSRSPSCGLRNIKIFSPTNKLSSSNGVGLFAKELTKVFPLLPIEDEERLHNPKYRENFIELILVMKRWRELNWQRKNLKNLLIFHTKHKLLIMSHSVSYCKEMEKLLTNNPKAYSMLYQIYHQLLVKALRLHTTTQKHFKVLKHAANYCKSNLSSDENKELLVILDKYKNDLLPLNIPIKLIYHYAKKYRLEYLLEQHYFNPPLLS